MLRTVPGLDLPELHKPKQTPTRKLDCFCGMLPFAEALLPTMTALFERWDGGEDARGLFEQKIYHGLGTLSTDQAAALRQGFVKIRQLPERLQKCFTCCPPLAAILTCKAGIFRESFLTRAKDSQARVNRR